MPVEGTEVAYVHALENVLLFGDGTLQGIGQADNAFLAVFGEKSLLGKPSGSFESHGIIGLISAEPQEIFLHAADRPVYGHVVVIEHDEQVVGNRRDIIESLKGESTTHSAVTDDGHDLTGIMIK